ncbi:hypothetical protein Hanom_Chr00s000003g01601781 [Helianthus anomalus]
MVVGYGGIRIEETEILDRRLLRSVYVKNTHVTYWTYIRVCKTSHHYLIFYNQVWHFEGINFEAFSLQSIIHLTKSHQAIMNSSSTQAFEDFTCEMSG